MLYYKCFHLSTEAELHDIAYVRYGPNDANQYIDVLSYMQLSAFHSMSLHAS